jgi:hydrogenase nickel incorporation protein HypA/HybF
VHELGLIQEVLDIVSEASGGATVRRIVLEVGSLALVAPDALRFAFEVARDGTPAAEASLEIVPVAGEELRVRAMEVA